MAFTLVELLVVIGIIAVLVGMLLPVVNSARAEAMGTSCASNIHQLCLGLQNYASDFHGYFPPNNRFDAGAGTTANWCDEDRIGKYCGGKVVLAAAPGYGQMGGPLYTCPFDDRSLRSYAMNVWTSCAVDPTTYTTPAQGALFRGSNIRMNAVTTILVAERWSTSGSPATGYYAPPFMGNYGYTPGPRFGVGGGVTITNTHWRPYPTSELPYLWHHRSGDGGIGTQSYGRVNIGYVDGHVVMKPVGDLANRTTGLSTLDSIWSPLDVDQNH